MIPSDGGGTTFRIHWLKWKQESGCKADRTPSVVLPAPTASKAAKEGFTHWQTFFFSSHLPKEEDTVQANQPTAIIYLHN